MVFALPTLTLSNLDPISSRRPINIHHAPITPTQLIESHSGSSRRTHSSAAGGVKPGAQSRNGDGWSRISGPPSARVSVRAPAAQRQLSPPTNTSLGTASLAAAPEQCSLLIPPPPAPLNQGAPAPSWLSSRAPPQPRSGGSCSARRAAASLAAAPLAADTC